MARWVQAEFPVKRVTCPDILEQRVLRLHFGLTRSPPNLFLPFPTCPSLYLSYLCPDLCEMYTEVHVSVESVYDLPGKLWRKFHRLTWSWGEPTEGAPGAGWVSMLKYIGRFRK